MAHFTVFLLLLQANAVCFIASAAVFEYTLPAINQSPSNARTVAHSDCYHGDGADYRDSWSLTSSGKECQPWTNSANVNPWNHPGKGLGEHNFCRNPDNDKQPWCWVDDLGTEYEYCSLPLCSENTSSSEPLGALYREKVAPAECYHGDGSGYRGTVSVTDKGSPCLSWSGSTTINPTTHKNKGLGEHNHCRNPDGDKKPWCWISHRDTKFGYCDIPKCSSTPSSPLPSIDAVAQDVFTATLHTETASVTECHDGDGSAYKGNVSVTEGGSACLKWTDSKYINPSSHPGKGLGDHTSCRNPDGDSRPWCWVDHRRRKFGYCDIPKCPSSVPTTLRPPATTTDKASTASTTLRPPATTTDKRTDLTVTDCYSGDGTTYRGFANTTEGGLPCQRWTSNSRINPLTHPDSGLADHNFCRNPDQDKKPWCWVSSTKFAYCQVSHCAPVVPAPVPTGNGSNTCGGRPVDQALTRLRLKRFVETPPEDAASKIVGGNIPMYGMYPWQASVRVITNVYSDGRVSAKHNCGGTIIGEFWILSAAHCFVGLSEARLIVYVGDHNLYNKEAYEQRFQVDRILGHILYSKVTHDYDIALLKLKPVDGKGIQFDDYVQPACLPAENTPYTERKMCFISGWGKTETTSPSLLRAAEVPLVSDSRCRRLHRGISPRMICAGLIQGGVDTCSGDSGGPLVCEEQGRYLVMGVTSWGVDCGAPASPGVYTKVTELLPWIERNMNSYS